MQVCTSLQTDNHASTPPLSFLQAGCPSSRPTNSVKALKALTTEENCSTITSQQIELMEFERLLDLLDLLVLWICYRHSICCGLVGGFVADLLLICSTTSCTTNPQQIEVMEFGPSQARPRHTIFGPPCIFPDL